MHNSKRMLGIGLLGALSLVGCGGKIRYPNYYVLSVPASVPAANRSAPILGSVGVREFDAPRFLKAGAIVSRESPEQLDFYDFHRWADDPRRMVTDAMVREMRARGLFHSVDLFDGRGSPECLVTGTLDHLEEVREGKDVSIEVGLSARLINLRTGDVLWQGSSSKNEKLDQRSVPGIVAEMSREMTNIVVSLVSSLQDGISTNPSALSRSNTQP